MNRREAGYRRVSAGTTGTTTGGGGGGGPTAGLGVFGDLNGCYPDRL
ncbi:MAG: hypothetical protein LBK99_15835 [Opitutaceae bacterium]|nr:hypothetical protein [Opitutaceae bacterium]